MSEQGQQLGAFEAAGEALSSICETVSALTCPYFRGEGICQSGCRDSPGCWEANASTESMVNNLTALVIHLEVDAFAGLAEQVERRLLEYRKDGEPGADGE